MVSPSGPWPPGHHVFRTPGVNHRVLFACLGPWPPGPDVSTGPHFEIVCVFVRCVCLVSTLDFECLPCFFVLQVLVLPRTLDSGSSIFH